MKRYLWLFAIGYLLAFSALRAEADAVKILNVSPNKNIVGLYEKFELSIDIEAAYTNPYDPDDIDLSAEFVSPKGKIYKIAAFYYQAYKRSISSMGGPQALEEAGSPTWKARFSPTQAGTWKYILTLKTQAGSFKSSPLTFKCSPSSNRGFIRVSKKAANYFAFDD